MINGIDISEHNGYIDFEKVKNDGIEFVILRAGWTGNKENHTIDKYFEDYYKRAKENRLKVGIYIYNYCNSINSILSGCRWLQNLLKGKEIDLPVFIDMEDESISNLSKDTLTDICINFCKFFENIGFKSGIYANKDWFSNKLDINRLLDYKIWLAEWNGKENHTFKYKVDLWQYTSKGKVAGISTAVDRNKCLCNCENIKEDKTPEELAKEVIEGKWGNGQERKNKLGNLYDKVQAIVNSLLNNKKSNEEIAKEVIKGKWGNGQERKEKLIKAGYNYNEVQAIVNKLLK